MAAEAVMRTTMKMITIATMIGRPGMRTKTNLIQGMRKMRTKEITMNTTRTKMTTTIMITIVDEDMEGPTSMMKMMKTDLITATVFAEIITGRPRTATIIKVQEQGMDAGAMAIQEIPVMVEDPGLAEAIPADKAVLKITDPVPAIATPADPAQVPTPAIQAQAGTATEVSAVMRRDIL
jgi:hypothetical protein